MPGAPNLTGKKDKRPTLTPILGCEVLSKSSKRLFLAGLYIALTLASSTGVALQMYLMQVQNPSLRSDLCQAPGEEKPLEHSLFCGLQVAPGLPFVEEPVPSGPSRGLRAKPLARLGHSQPLPEVLAPRPPPTSKRWFWEGSAFGRGEVVALRVTLFASELEFYALVAGPLMAHGIEVLWREEGGLALADLEHMEKGQVVLWRTPQGIRAWDARYWVFLTRKDDPTSLARALLRGQTGLALRPGERVLWEAMGRLGSLRTAHLAQATGMQGHQVRFHLRGLRQKFGLCDLNLLRLARHSYRLLTAGWEGLEKRREVG